MLVLLVGTPIFSKMFNMAWHDHFTSEEEKEKERSNPFYVDKHGNQRWKSNGHLRGLGSSKVLEDGTKIAWDYDATSGLNVNYRITNQNELDARKTKTEEYKEIGKNYGLLCYYDYDMPINFEKQNLYHIPYHNIRRETSSGKIVRAYIHGGFNGYLSYSPIRCEKFLFDTVDGDAVSKENISLQEYLSLTPMADNCRVDTNGVISYLIKKNVIHVSYPIKNNDGKDNLQYGIYKLDYDEFYRLLMENASVKRFATKYPNNEAYLFNIKEAKGELK